MRVEMELWHLILLLLAFFGGVTGFGRVLLEQIEKRIDEKFAEQGRSLASAADRVEALERDFLRWQADLPVQYVRRDDYIRNQTVIEAKIDGLALKMENVYLKGLRND